MNESNPYEPPDADITPEPERFDRREFAKGCCVGVLVPNQALNLRVSEVSPRGGATGPARLVESFGLGFGHLSFAFRSEALRRYQSIQTLAS